nr:ABC transporter ATP-binding protein [uncultured Methanolobus sp.]
MRMRLQGVSFDYSSSSVLKDVDMELHPGEILGIIGPNGAGKSTLIKCIDRILHPQGSVMLDGSDMGNMGRMDVAKCIAYVPQSPDMSFPTTVLDTVLMGRRPHSSWNFSQNDIDKALNALDMLNIADLAMRDFARISGGQQQRVFIARAIAQETGIMLLDEPTSSLDIKYQMSLMEILKKLVDELDISVMMAIHDLNMAVRYSHRLILMSEGRIVAAGEPLDVLNENNMREHYGVEAVAKFENGVPYIVPLKLV